MLKWNLSFDSSSNEKDEDVSEKLDLSHLKVDEVPQKNFWDNPSPPILLTLGVPGLENHHESKFGTNYSSSPPLENLHKESRGKKRKREEDFMSKFDGNGSGTTSRRNEDDLQQYSKTSSVEMHKMSERVSLL
ncbi:hypothetical protein HAX54_009074 [Datura stramonium]|uniref:Uncharacterized protein n=1 Tax=Datura stramonium TaxID=4076 RepID=A0ABS8RWJ2_DATST|nr:hypothetical protein [Datura stramonium]